LLEIGAGRVLLRTILRVFVKYSLPLFVITEDTDLLVTNMILWHLENMLTLAVMCMHVL